MSNGRAGGAGKLRGRGRRAAARVFRCCSDSVAKLSMTRVAMYKWKKAVIADQPASAAKEPGLATRALAQIGRHRQPPQGTPPGTGRIRPLAKSKQATETHNAAKHNRPTGSVGINPDSASKEWRGQDEEAGQQTLTLGEIRFQGEPTKVPSRYVKHWQ
jgi:hypothetical protein